VRTIAFANQKGGVGKTTSAVNLAAGLAQLGHPTVLLDCDPQANASTALGFFESALHYPIEQSAYRLFSDEGSIDQVASPTQFPNLRIVVGSRELSGLEIELVDFEDRDKRLRAAIDRSDRHAEFIILDTPPSLGLLTLNCLTAADEIIVPVQCEFLSLAGVARLLDTIRAVQNGGNPALRVTGILPTMFDSRTNLAKEVADDLRRHFPGLVFDTVIPRSVRMAEAPSYGLPIVDYAPTSSGAVAYMKFVAEVLAR
jgi:chromosome partitioning protein